MTIQPAQQIKDTFAKNKNLNVRQQAHTELADYPINKVFNKRKESLFAQNPLMLEKVLAKVR